MDTSIWLDFFEKRDEPNLKKGEFAKALIEQAIAHEVELVYSDAVIREMRGQGYAQDELDVLLLPFRKLLRFVEANNKQVGKARDLTAKRKVPFMDALHALLARDSQATLITRDAHFKLLLDIVKSKKPEEVT